MTRATPRPAFTTRAAEVLGSVRTLVVPTDLGDTDCLEVAREAARLAADGHDVSVVLYDRSSETWMDTPHPSGPLEPDDLGEEHARLADQLTALRSQGVDAVGWISTVPALTDIVTAVHRLDADAVLLPEEACDRTMMDRLTGTGDTNLDVTNTLDHLPRRVAVLGAGHDGQVDLIAITKGAEQG